MSNIENNGPQVDVDKVINSLLRQISESAKKIAILEAILEQGSENANPEVTR